MSQELIKIEIEDEAERFMSIHAISLEDIKKVAPEVLLKMDGCGYRLLLYFKKQMRLIELL